LIRKSEKILRAVVKIALLLWACQVKFSRGKEESKFKGYKFKTLPTWSAGL
jgi:hypothetical protein